MRKIARGRSLKEAYLIFIFFGKSVYSGRYAEDVLEKAVYSTNYFYKMHNFEVRCVNCT